MSTTAGDSDPLSIHRSVTRAPMRVSCVSKNPLERKGAMSSPEAERERACLEYRLDMEEIPSHKLKVELNGHPIGDNRRARLVFVESP